MSSFPLANLFVGYIRVSDTCTPLVFNSETSITKIIQIIIQRLELIGNLPCVRKIALLVAEQCEICFVSKSEIQPNERKHSYRQCS